ncbi:MAG: hypothetical protein ACFBSE_00055 [Prochloraceae cyanobacterium]
MSRERIECPYCGTMVKKGLIVCRGCGADIIYDAPASEGLGLGCLLFFFGIPGGLIYFLGVMLFVIFIGILDNTGEVGKTILQSVELFFASERGELLFLSFQIFCGVIGLFLSFSWGRKIARSKYKGTVRFVRNKRYR